MISRKQSSPIRRRLYLTVLCALLTQPLCATLESKLPEATLRQLERVSVVQTKLHLERVPLSSGRSAAVDLREFEVWSPGGRLMIAQADGSFRYQTPEPVRYFGGSVVGYPDSTAMFSIGDKSGVSGVMMIDDRRFEVRRLRTSDGGGGRDYGVVELEPGDAYTNPALEPWTCGNEALTQPLPPASAHKHLVAETLKAVSRGLANGTQQYVFTIQIETDPQFYALFGPASPAADAALTMYVTNLIAAMSAVYQRDLTMQVQIANIVIRPTTDIWTNASSTNALLDQLGTTYASTPALQAIQRGTVALLSGKPLHGGIAWVGTAGSGDCLPAMCGQTVGAYAVCTSYDNVGLATPDPNNTVNGVQFGFPQAFGNDNYWGLAQIAHEVGHNLGSPHTHCMVLTAAEAAAQGRPYVDVCYGNQNSCYSGAVSVPLELGTLMSYCHLTFSNGFPNSRFTFGKLTNYTHHVLDDPEVNSSRGLHVTMATYWPAMTGITAPSVVAASSAGNAASVIVTSYGTSTFIGGANSAGSAGVRWAITGGTITAGQGTSSITFTAGASGTVALRATAISNRGSGITDTKAVTITGGVAAAPTVSAVAPASGALAGGTSVTITGANFQNGATVKFGIAPATNVSVTTTSTITAKTPAGIAGAVSVIVTNPDAQLATLANGFTYTNTVVKGDANGDGAVSVADIFYLINTLFASGPAAVAGDANGDGIVTVADVFYLINFLFAGGPAPLAMPRAVSQAVALDPVSFSLGDPATTSGGWVVPVYAHGARIMRGLSIAINHGAAESVAIRPAGAASLASRVFEATPARPGGVAYITSFDRAVPIEDHALVAEIVVRGTEKPATASLTLDGHLSAIDTSRGNVVGDRALRER